MARNIVICLHLLVLSVNLRIADGFGLCYPEHPQTAVCRAKFVVKAKIISVDWERDSMTTKTQKPTTESMTTTEERVATATTKTFTTAAATTEKTTTVEIVPSTVPSPLQEGDLKISTTEKNLKTNVLPEGEDKDMKPETTQSSVDRNSTKSVNVTDSRHSEGEKKEGMKKDTAERPDTKRGSSMAAGLSFQASYFLRPKIIRIEIQKLYKGLKLVNTPVGQQTNMLFASPHRTHLKVGKSYLLTGMNIGNKLMTNECNWHAEWDSLTMTQLHGLRRYYWLYCRCQIRFCPDGRCRRGPRSCTWVVPLSAIDAKKADLLSSFSVCMVRCGACGFYNPRQTVDCYPNRG